MSDLDVRDAQNRPVSSPSALQDLTALFMDNLFNLTVVSSQHQMRQIWNDIELFSHLFNGLIFNVLYPALDAILYALQPSTKRFVHNVHNVWITLALAACLTALLSTRILTKACHQAVVLRC